MPVPGSSGALAYADRAAPWLIALLGFSIPISTALDGLLVVLLLACWLAGGRYRAKLEAIRGNPLALAALAWFVLHAAGSLYSSGTPNDVQYALGKEARLLLIPVLISLRPDVWQRERALSAFKAATVLILLLSFLIWLGLMPDGVFAERSPVDPVVFKLKITHGVLMAFGAFAFALQARDAADRRQRWLSAAVAALAAFNVIYMVPGRTGQLVLLALLVYFFVGWFRWRGLLVGAVAAVSVTGAVYLAPSSAFHQRLKVTIVEFADWRAGKPAQASNLRLEAWTNSLDIIRDHAWIGVGTGGFPAAYARKVQGTAMTALPQPENQYVFTTVQLGVLGLAALLALFALQWHWAQRLETRRDTALARALVITMLVGCMFNSFLLDHAEALFYVWLSGLLFAGLRPAAARSG